MKRIAQFLSIGMLSCMLVGCGGQPAVPSPSPSSTQSPSLEATTTPIVSPSATASVLPSSDQSSKKPATTKQPETTPVKPTQKPATNNTSTKTSAPESTTKPTSTTETSKPSYQDATSCRGSILKGVNAARSDAGLKSASTSSSLNSVAQERARKMATAQSVSHIGQGYSEAVGRMSSANGSYNVGFNAVAMHCPQLKDCTQYGIGVAVGRDGQYYYSIIGK